MYLVALQMLINDKAKFVGILLGVTLASLVITQQSSIFVGIMTRAYSAISDIPAADVWVMDPKVQYIDDTKPMAATELNRVRGVEGVAWAVPLYKGIIRARLENGQFQNCNVFGIDDATLVAGPIRMVHGRLEDLRRDDAVIVDRFAANTRLARPPTEPGGKPRPLAVGDTLELNDHRAVVVGICDITRTFQNLPTIFTTYSRATTFAPRERKLLSFVLVKAAEGVDPGELCATITRHTGLGAYTADQFRWATVLYFLRNTGIPINFGIAIALGFFIGTAITGFMFYNFTLDNLKYFAAFKAMGATDSTLLGMILLQALTVAVLGFGLGSGLVSWFGASMQGTALAFRLIWQTLLIAGAAVVVISMLAAILACHKVVRLEPATVFKG
ncbi:MAG: ABC transporter permease [Phycisphaeraceae bacterium]|nr:MAG: ABC transporter permease [Phycisphaeraceae bacterium]